ncbi:neck protein [Serratia phage Moabite]|uniref:Neck protein n=1 Tax=Serratia phage Moabite TaxID=2587814 RepID=A0A4Y5TRK0_9CAUD|nr:neck protein [Serratia phage Moabite]QDB71221.1 neck protein [Serratia phage Moabite]
MANSSLGNRISELPRSTRSINDADLTPISQIKTNNPETVAATVGDIRATLDFDNAYNSIPEGLAGTFPEERFYVYTDNSKRFVNGYINKNGVSEVILDKSGQPRRWATPLYMLAIGEQSITVASVDQMRIMAPQVDGQVVRMRNFRQGNVQYKNGGDWVYDANDKTTKDDGVMCVVTNTGERFKRDISSGSIETDWFFDPVMDIADYSLTLNKAAEWVEVKGTEWWQTWLPSTPAYITMVGPGGVRTCKKPVWLRMWAVSWDFRGTLLDFTGGAVGQTNVSVVYGHRNSTLSNLRMLSSVALKQKGINVSTTSGNIHGLSAAFLNFNNISINRHDIAWDLGDNCYLNNWFQCTTQGCRLPINAPKSANAGETLVWTKCIFGDGIGPYLNTGMSMTFHGCSFDYSGYKTEADQLANAEKEGLFNIDNCTVIMYGCGNEYGNLNSRWTGPVWRGSGIIKLYECQWILTQSSTVEPKETTPHLVHNYYFEDTSADLSSKVYLEGFYVPNPDLNRFSGSWTNGCFIKVTESYPGRYKDMWRNYTLGKGANMLISPNPNNVGYLTINRSRCVGGTVISPTETSLFKVSTNGNKLVITSSDTTKAPKTLSFYTHGKAGNWYGSRLTVTGNRAMPDVRVGTNCFGVVGYVAQDNSITSLGEQRQTWTNSLQGITTTAQSTPGMRMTQLGTTEYLPLCPPGTEWVRVSIEMTNFGISAGEEPAVLEITDFYACEVGICRDTNHRVW